VKGLEPVPSRLAFSFLLSGSLKVGLEVPPCACDQKGLEKSHLLAARPISFCSEAFIPLTFWPFFSFLLGYLFERPVIRPFFVAPFGESGLFLLSLATCSHLRACGFFLFSFNWIFFRQPPLFHFLLSTSIRGAGGVLWNGSFFLIHSYRVLPNVWFPLSLSSIPNIVGQIRTLAGSLLFFRSLFFGSRYTFTTSFAFPRPFHAGFAPRISRRPWTGQRGMFLHNKI